MSVKSMYLALLAAAVVAGCLLGWLDAGADAFSSGRAFGTTIGMSGSLFLVAALVPTMFVFRKRTPSSPSVASLTAVGIIVLAAFSHCSFRGMEAHRTLASFAFEAPGCTFSASFPESPEVKELVVAGGLVVTQANLYELESFLRAECLATNGWFAPTREAVTAELHKLARRDGLIDITIQVRPTDGLVHGILRGYKTVSGKPATYEVHVFADGASLMSLAAGGLSSGYPQSGIHEFLTSGRRVATRVP
jgi:hypothetical protein